MPSFDEIIQYPPEGYTAQSLESPDPEGDLWCSVEDLAIDGLIGADPYDSDLDVALFDSHGKLAGASWSTQRNSSYGFHFAVSRELQGKGLGSFLMDAAVARFKEQKANNPELSLDVCVVNDDVVAPLLRRGLCVESEDDEIEQNRTYYMMEAPSFEQILKKSMQANTQETMLAMRIASEKSGLSTEQFTEWLIEWGNTPTPLQTNEESAWETLLVYAPFSKYEKQYLTADSEKFRKNKSFTPFLTPTDNTYEPDNTPSQGGPRNDGHHEVKRRTLR